VELDDVSERRLPRHSSRPRAVLDVGAAPLVQLLRVVFAVVVSADTDDHLAAVTSSVVGVGVGVDVVTAVVASPPYHGMRRVAVAITAVTAHRIIRRRTQNVAGARAMRVATATTTGWLHDCGTLCISVVRSVITCSDGHPCRAISTVDPGGSQCSVDVTAAAIDAAAAAAAAALRRP
jgi:hypothetical protein